MSKKRSSEAVSEKTSTEDCSSFTWKIQNFSTLTKLLYSDTFTAGGHKWNVLIYPKGNPQGDYSDHLAIYLNVADVKTLPDGWTKPAKFSLSVINQLDDSNSVKRETEHTFSAKLRGWGYPSFMALRKLRDINGGFVVKDTCIVKAEVWCDEKQKHQKLDRKEEEQADFINTDIKAEDSSSAVGEFDVLLSDIQNVFESKPPTVAGASTRLQQFQLTEHDIVVAKRILQECSNMKIATIFQSGRASELKNSLYTTLIANAFSNKPVLGIANFLTEFDLYLAARRGLQEADEKESSINELKGGLKRYFLELVPIKSRVNEVDREAAELERRLAERNAKKESFVMTIDAELERQLGERNAEKMRLKDSLEKLAARVTASRKALIDAEQEMRVLEEKKERAKELSGNTERLWESLNKD